MEFTEEWIKEQVDSYAPALYMHPDDKFLPCTAEWFLERSELWLDEHTDKQASILDKTFSPILSWSDTYIWKYQTHGFFRLLVSE